MAAESIWPGMFQAEVGIGSAATVIITAHASSLIWSIGGLSCRDVICHGQITQSTTTKKGFAPALNFFSKEAGNDYKNHCRFTLQFSSQFTWPRSSPAAEKSCSYRLFSIGVSSAFVCISES